MPNAPEAFERRVRERAYYLWLRAGEPSGLDDEFWRAALSAETILQDPGPTAGRRWPEISPKIVKDDNAKILLERADAVIKGQDDGLRAMEGRMSTLLGINITLATAAIAAEITALAQNPSPSWVQPWTVPALSVLLGFWLLAIVAAAVAMIGRQWALPGMGPAHLYRATFLSENTNRFRMNLARTLQEAIDENRKAVEKYSRRLSAVILLLASGPLGASLVVIWLTGSNWLAYFCAFRLPF